MKADFRNRLNAGECLYGTMVTMPTPTVAEILCQVGFDWLFIDAEHGPFDTDSLLRMLQSVGDRTACLVRVAEGHETAIKKVLDLGADGIIVPQVNSASEAEAVVRAAKYSPQGNRGVGLARAHGYGMQFKEYVETANERTVVVVQAEHIDAVENIETIVEVPGIDAILIGPYDLSASMGKMGQVDDPEVISAINRVAQVCKERKMTLGYFGVSADAVKPYVEQGYSLIVAGVDTLFISAGSSRMLKSLRE